MYVCGRSIVLCALLRWALNNSSINSQPTNTIGFKRSSCVFIITIMCVYVSDIAAFLLSFLPFEWYAHHKNPKNTLENKCGKCAVKLLLLYENHAMQTAATIHTKRMRCTELERRCMANTNRKKAGLSVWK